MTIIGNSKSSIMKCQRDINRIENEVFLKQHYCWPDDKYLVVAAKTSSRASSRTLPQSTHAMGNGTDVHQFLQQTTTHYEEKNPLESTQSLGHILCTITVTPIFFALSRIVTKSFFTHQDEKCFWIRYLTEFIMITVPVVISVNCLNNYVEWLVLVVVLIILKFLLSRSFRNQLELRQFECGQRPALLTLLRSNISYLTALCILAVDFPNFPTNFRKTRQYGVGLMDVGIGLFVAAMGLVSHRPHKLQDFRKILTIVSWLIALGFARTISLNVIDYHQDEHEYGEHLNAFFTLAFTKFFGSLISALFCSDLALLPIGLVIIAVHEAFLQYGLADYVMSDTVKRNSFLSSNREGIYSTPGFVAIYILCMFVGKSVRLKSINSSNFLIKLRYLTFAAIFTWSLLIYCNFITGIARVTCNIGYVCWILALVVTMSCVYIIFFDMILDTLSPLNFKVVHGPMSESRLPLLVEAINYNGLVFFILANLMTGAVNIFMSPEHRDNIESIAILTTYMFICTTVSCILYRFQIRIA